MKITKTPESRAIIRFPDCDPFNHLNNSRYIDYFINAREDHLVNNHDFDVYRYAKKQVEAG
ncbi:MULTISPECIES: thioesterase family protein [Aquimarina]|uniref:thioesterase family protein n=1 Tax=Aquimarina TaxID=290174 RepID=UPI0009433DC8|nr:MULTISPECIES: thioesterase family protein [Aquimarina]